MFKLFQNILLFFMVLFNCFSAAAQLAMPDIVCIGATKHYGVNANSLSGSTYTWNINGVAQLSTINEIDITWNTEGTYLLTVQELSKDGCLGPLRSGQVFVNANPTINASVTMHPNCSVSTGSIELSGLPVGNWTINPGAITGSTSSVTLSGLSAGTYAYTVTNAAGCISAASADVVIDAQPATPTALVTAVTQPTCVTSTGTITVTVQNAGETYSFDNGASFQTSNIKSGLVAGSYNIIIKSTGGCNSTATSTAVNTQPADLPVSVSIAASENPVCEGTSVTFTATPTNGGATPAYQWYKNTVAVGTNSATYTYIPVTGDQVYVVLTSSLTCSSGSPATSAKVTMTVNTYTVTFDKNTGDTEASPTSKTATCGGNVGTLPTPPTKTGYTFASWNTAADGSGTAFTATTVVTADITVYAKWTISIFVPDCDFNIPKGFSPNGDGINDRFVIRGIDCYPNNTIRIYNRWGNKVFEASPYQNTWDGRSHFGLRVGGDQLPDGTYFYILDLGDGSDIYKSYIYIKK